MNKINVALVKLPYTIKDTQYGAAPLNIGQAIGLLNNECQNLIKECIYLDYNDSLFYLFSKLIYVIIKDKETALSPLLPIESLWVLERMMVEEAFDIPDGIRTVLGIEKELIAKILTVYYLSIDNMIEKIVEKDCKAALIYASPSIVYPILFIKKLKEKNENISVCIMDNLTFEPGAVYFSNIVTGKGVKGEKVDMMYQNDPIFFHLHEHVKKYIDIIVKGEGFDFLRQYFKSNKYEKEMGCIVNYYNCKCEEIKISNKLSYGSDLNNKIAIVESERVDLNKISFPDYTSMKEIYDVAEIEIIRGCTYACVFCERTRMLDSQITYHSIEYVIDELIYLKEQGFSKFTIIDCAANIDEKFIIKFLERLKEKKLDIKYQCNLRGKIPNENLLKLLKETGCVEIALGIESGDEKLLCIMNKQQNMNIIKSLTSKISKYNIKQMLFLIIGFPTETIDSVENTISLISEISENADIDAIELEFYHAGFIQKLSPVKFPEYEMEWIKIKSKEEIASSSFLYSGISVYGGAIYNRGMTREELKEAIKKYASVFKEKNINLVTFYF